MVNVLSKGFFESWRAAELRCGELQRELKSQRELNELVESELLELLKKCEWTTNDSEMSECPCCGNWRRIGHVDDCELANLLAST